MKWFEPSGLRSAAMMLVGLSACGPGEQLEKDMAAMHQALSAQRSQQTALLSRVERLETRVAVLTSATAAPRAAAPVEVDPLDGLPIVRLAPSGSSAADAPPLDTRVRLRVPSAEELDRLTSRPANLNRIVEHTDPAVEAAFAAGVQQYNAGARLDAARVLLDVARAHPRHAVADNALYLAGLAHMIHDDCAQATPLLTEVVDTYPDGDAEAPAMLALGQCATAGDRLDEARGWFDKVIKKHPRTPESTQAEAALSGLGRSRAAQRP